MADYSTQALSAAAAGGRGGHPRLRSSHAACGTFLAAALAGGRRALLRELIEMLADMGGFGRRVGERDRPVEGGARLGVAAEPHQQRSLETAEVEIAVEWTGERRAACT